MLVRLSKVHIIETEDITKIEESSGNAVITCDDGTTTMTVTGQSVGDVWDTLEKARAQSSN